jgi:drug/metabolite transporter (DMT)-like permease
MSRARGVSGYANGLISGATWGVVAVLLDWVAARMPGHLAVATALVIAAVHDLAAAFFLVTRLTVVGGLPRILGLVWSRSALTIAACSLLGGPVFMGGYVVALVLSGPSYSLTATATYPVFGALFAQRLLHQRLNWIAWLGVMAAGLGAALTAFDASSSADGARTLLGVVIALTAAAGLALEGVVATYAMVKIDADTAMAVRQIFSAILLWVIVLAVPHGISTAVTVSQTRDLYLPLLVAGCIGGYSFAIWYHSIRKIGVAKAMALNITYAMWGILFAWVFAHATTGALAITGCVIVSIGAVLVIMSGERPAGGHSDERQASLDTEGITRRGPAGDRPAC